MISNLGVLKKVFDADDTDMAATTEDDEREAPKLRSKVGLFLALVVLTAIGEATVLEIRKRQREGAT
ncbi:hypothetical protein ACFQL3_07070 [Natronoarchaeum sp. GCM10025321]|uniref:hypothetical protein n=1 Tax=Natronoarchaeum sp. GCM10025321 TaxID=3252684 RepID=UPI003614F3E0